MAPSFQANIKLGPSKKGPLTHTGFKGRQLKKGASFTTTNPEEAAYYAAQPAFSVTVVKGKLFAKPKEELEVVEPDEVETDSDDDSDDDEEDPEGEVKGGYERADLKKMSRDDLLALIKSDDDLPLRVRDLPKKAGKREIIDAILEAQTGTDD